MTDSTSFHFTRKGRSWATLIAIVITWLLCLIAWTVFDASGWIVGIVLAFSLPAVWDMYSARLAGASLSDSDLSWFSGDQSVTVPLSEIDHMRLVTRLDLSVRAAVVLKTGRKMRLPPESTPPHQAFETALTESGLKVERHHFTFL